MKRRGCIALLLTLLVTLVGLTLWVKYGRFWEIDYCYDSGGYWNRMTDACVR